MCIEFHRDIVKKQLIAYNTPKYQQHPFTFQSSPNPTTILESMSWGFPVVCTPQSGYYETSYRKNIYHDDFDRSVEVLRQLQFADENVLQEMSTEARRVVERDYTWDRFIDTICSALDIT